MKNVPTREDLSRLGAMRVGCRQHDYGILELERAQNGCVEVHGSSYFDFWEGAAKLALIGTTTIAAVAAYIAVRSI
jgi:hypothetical protein